MLKGMNLSRYQTRIAAIPRQLGIGLALIAISWPLNWLLPGLRTHLLFFPLWLGFSLTVDGLVFLRKRTSLLKRNWRAYVGLFAVSAPAWWLFELINARTQNWEYVGKESFTGLEYAVLASLSFSTVMPAVFGAAELVSTWGWLKNLHRGMVIKASRAVTVAAFIGGLAMLALMLAWPLYFFPLVWLSMFFILEPINIWRGHRSLSASLADGDWRPIVSIWLGALMCGFFWEFWNFYSYPRWIYHVPFVDFLHVFEMPILGYGGYLPFGMELFALYHMVTGLFGAKLSEYLHTEPYRSNYVSG